MSFLVFNQRSWVKPLVIVTLAVGMTACGGGGSDDDYSPISYTGSLTAADIDSSNYQELGTGAFIAGSQGDTGSFLGIQQQSTEQAKPGMMVITSAISRSVKDSLRSSRESTLSGVTITDSTTGPCGGSITASLDFTNLGFTNPVEPDTPTSGDFSGTFSFRNYCESNITIAGSVVISGGSFDDDLGTSSFTGTSNLVIRDDVSGATFKLENYVIVMDSTSTYRDIWVTGRFYHPVHGYADVITITALRTDTSNIPPDLYPFSGVIKVVEVSTGVQDSVTLTALDATWYRVDYDIGNDGGVPDASFTGEWAKL